MSKTFRLYEGFNFKLTDEQVESIREALDELAASHNENKSEANQSGLLAQVWVSDEGAFCCVHVVPGGKAKIIRDVLRATDLSAIKIEFAR